MRMWRGVAGIVLFLVLFLADVALLHPGVAVHGDRVLWEKECASYLNSDAIAREPRFFVYPLRSTSALASLNADIIKRNRGWVDNEWNQHNQYILELVIHENLQHSTQFMTQDPSKATHFLLPFFGRIGMYEGELLRKLQDALLSELVWSPWFQRSRGCNHILVWTSQRPLKRLLGDTLARLLRKDSFVRFLAVEDVDPRPGALRFEPGRDIKVPPYVPPAVAQLANKVQMNMNDGAKAEGNAASALQQQQQQQQLEGTIGEQRTDTATTCPVETTGSNTSAAAGHSSRGRHTFVYFAGTLKNSAVRVKLRKALLGKAGCVVTDAGIKMLQDRNASSSHSLAVKQVVQGTLRDMASAEFCLCPRGITPGTRRIFEAILVGCIPVIVSDAYRWPFPHLVQHLSEAAIFVKEAEALSILDKLTAIPHEQRTHKRYLLSHLAHNITYHRPLAKPGDAFDQVMHALYKSAAHDS